MILPISLLPAAKSLNNVKLFEIYDRKLLNKLLGSTVLNTDGWNNFENEKDQLTKYKDITYEAGLVGVRYRRSNGYRFGRVYPIHSLSLCSLRREIRHTIARDLFVDIDIANAHPELIYQTARYHGIKCSILEEYVKHREEKLLDVMKTYNVSRDSAKDLFIMLLYFGSFQTWLQNAKLDNSLKPNEFISKYIEERTHYGEWIETNNEAIAYDILQAKVRRNIFDYNEKASVVSIWCQEIEQRILYELYTHCKAKKYIDNDGIVVLCFDGIMLKKEKYTPSILKEFSKVIEEKLGYKLTFTNKELNQGYNELLANDTSSLNNRDSVDDTNNDDSDDSTEEELDYLENDATESETTDEELEEAELEESNSVDTRRVESKEKKKEKKLEDDRVKKQDKEFLKSLEIISHYQCAEIFYNQNPKKYIYSSIMGWLKYNKYNVIECHGKGIPDDIKSNITRDLHKYLIPIRNRMKPNSPSYVKDSKNINKLIKDCNNSKFLAGIIDFLSEMYVVRDIDTKLDANSNLFAFEDKVYDLSTYSIRDITPSDFISKTTRYKYATSNPAIRQKLTDFIKNIFMIDESDNDGLDVYNYYLITKAHSLFGNKLESCYINIGLGGNGKGTLISTLEKLAFGDYIYFTENTFITSQFRQGAPNPTLAECKGIRQLIIAEPSDENEFGKETAINAPFLKLITGNDRITTRQVHCKNFSYNPLFTPFIQTNTAPTIKKIDNGIMRRIKMINFPISFVDNPIGRYQKLRDSNLKIHLETEEYAREYLLLLLDIVNVNRNINTIRMPKRVEEQTKEYFDDNNITIDFIRRFVRHSERDTKCVDLFASYNAISNGNSNSVDIKAFIRSMVSNGFITKKRDGYKIFKNIEFIGFNNGLVSNTNIINDDTNSNTINNNIDI